MHARRHSVCLVAFAALATLAACGSSNRRPTAAVQPDVAITAPNALDIARAAYHTAFDPVRVARIATAFFEVAPPEPPTSPATLGVFVQDLAGPEGGSAIWTWDDRDDDGHYSSGDDFTLVLADYGDNGLVLTGAVAFDEVAIQGDVVDGLTWVLATSLQMIGVQLTIGEQTSTLTGPFRCVREKRATVRLLSLDARADIPVGLRTLQSGSALARNDYQLDFTMGLFANGTFTDPVLGGTLMFATETPMTGIQMLADPSTGEFTVEGANGSTLVIKPLDYFTLEIHVDENGDGEVDATIPAEWAGL